MNSTTRPTLLILAAGMGSRYGGLKQIDAVGPSGETILDFSVYDASRAGFGQIVFVIRRDIEDAFRQSIGARFEQRVPVKYVFQEIDDLPPGFTVPAGRTKPWGTTQAVLAAAEVIHEPFAVINADDFYGQESFQSLSRHLLTESLGYAMIGFILRNTLSEFGSVARGISAVDENGYLASVVEVTGIERDSGEIKAAGGIPLSGDEIVSMNMWGFTPRVFDQLRAYFESFLEANSLDQRAECYLPNAVNSLIHSGESRVRVLPTSEAWFGVTYREDRPRVVESIGRLVSSGVYPERLWP
ncbi:MAG TPA: sugar phosphate nucleotidyltransferase [Terracidiphilus sp.]|nr:sugar phosphate nucleotidyltransferase [Terracidiphilus sp.]